VDYEEGISYFQENDGYFSSYLFIYLLFLLLVKVWYNEKDDHLTISAKGAPEAIGLSIILYIFLFF
jgi:hypothetical protein